MSSGSFNNVTYKLFVYKSYILNLFVETGFDNKWQRGLIWYKIQPTNQSTNQPSNQGRSETNLSARRER